MIGSWQHYQKLDYEQLPFKCRNCQEHGHFQRNCPKAQPDDKEDGEGWKKDKKNKASPNPSGKRSSVPSKNPPPVTKPIGKVKDDLASSNTNENLEGPETSWKDANETGEIGETADPTHPMEVQSEK